MSDTSICCKWKIWILKGFWSIRLSSVEIEKIMRFTGMTKDFVWNHLIWCYFNKMVVSSVAPIGKRVTHVSCFLLHLFLWYSLRRFDLHCYRNQRDGIWLLMVLNFPVAKGFPTAKNVIHVTCSVFFSSDQYDKSWLASFFILFEKIKTSL